MARNKWIRNVSQNRGLGEPLDAKFQQEVECTHCGISMTPHCGAESQIRYFYCPSCRRWVSSAYSEILRSDAKVQVHSPRPVLDLTCFAAVKARLERWLATLDDQDPFRLMGVSPSAPPETIRDRYRELALERHPDRGGSVREMQELNRTYERAARHRWQTAGNNERARIPPLPGALPAKTQ